MGRTDTDRQFQTNLVTVSDPPWNYSIEHNQAEHSFCIPVSGAEPLTGYMSFMKMKSSNTNIYFLFNFKIGIAQENVLNKINRSVVNCLTVEVEKIQAIFVEIVKK